MDASAVAAARKVEVAGCKLDRKRYRLFRSRRNSRKPRIELVAVAVTAVVAVAAVGAVRFPLHLC